MLGGVHAEKENDQNSDDDTYADSWTLRFRLFVLALVVFAHAQHASTRRGARERAPAAFAVAFVSAQPPELLDTRTRVKARNLDALALGLDACAMLAALVGWAALYGFVLRSGGGGFVLCPRLARQREDARGIGERDEWSAVTKRSPPHGRGPVRGGPGA